MKIVELKVAQREKTGKGHAGRLRKEKRIPAILYGGKMKQTIPLDVDLKEFKLAVKGSANVILTLKIQGGKKESEQTALIKEIQICPITDALEHIDFNAISLTEKIRVKVALHEKGEAPGIKEGGVLEHVHREIEVECLPTEIPDKIDVNIESLNIGDALHVRDLILPKGVVCTISPDEVVFTVLAPMKDEVVAPAAEEGAKEPEVIGKKKEEGEAAAPAAEGAKGEKGEKAEKK